MPSPPDTTSMFTSFPTRRVSVLVLALCTLPRARMDRRLSDTLARPVMRGRNQYPWRADDAPRANHKAPSIRVTPGHSPASTRARLTWRKSASHAFTAAVLGWVRSWLLVHVTESSAIGTASISHLRRPTP